MNRHRPVSAVGLVLLIAGGLLGNVGFSQDEGEPETGKLVERLQEMVVPVVEFQDTPLKDALQYLVLASKQLDPAGNAVNVVIGKGLDSRARITLRLSDVPWIEALRHTTQLAGLSFVIEEAEVVIIPQGESGKELFTRLYLPEPGAVARLGGRPPREVLGEAGIGFPAGAEATFNPANGQLVVRLTRAGVAKVEKWLKPE